MEEHYSPSRWTFLEDCNKILPNPPSLHDNTRLKNKHKLLLNKRLLLFSMTCFYHEGNVFNSESKQSRCHIGI